MRVADALLLTLILAAALAWPLRSPPIATHGEAREGLVVQDIVRRGDWVLPRRNGELPSKPPLFHWTAATAAAAFGLSDATVRFPSALAAWAMALATLQLGTAIGGRVTGWLAVGALLGMHRFWEHASQARVDMIFAACVTLALVAFFRWQGEGGRGARAICYLATGCAVLAKGPAGAVLPLLVVLVTLARTGLRGLGDGLRRLWSGRLVALVAAVDLGWYLLAYLEGGHAFLARQLVYENVDRFVGRGVFGVHGGRSRLTLAAELATALLPWSLVLVWAALRWWRGEREDAAGRFLHAWWMALLAFFTVAFGKRAAYLLPLYPAIALLAGRALATLVTGAQDRSRLAGRPVPRLVGRVFPAAPALALVAIAIVLFDVTLAGVGHAVREHQARRKSLVPFAAEVARAVPPGAPLFADAALSGSDLQVLAYRLGRLVPRASASSTATSPEGARVYCLVPALGADDLSRADYERVAVSARRGVDVALMLAPPDLGCTRPPPALAPFPR